MSQSSEKFDKLILAGKLVSPHGVKGRVKVYSYLESPENFSLYKNFYDKDWNKIKIEICSIQKNCAIIELSDIKDRNQAEKIIGKEIYIKQSDLPELEDNFYYYSDLIGIKILSVEGNDIGIISNVCNYGAGEIVEIKFSNGTKDFFSFTKNNFPEINIEESYIKFIPPLVEYDK